MTEASDTISSIETGSSAYKIEELKQKYGLYKVIAGTLLLGVIAAVLPFVINLYRVAHDKDTLRTEFIAKHVQIVQAAPPAERFAVVDYMAHVLPDQGQRDLWIAYRNHLSELQEGLIKSLDQAAKAIEAEAPDEEQIFLAVAEKQARLLSWAIPSDLIVLQMATYKVGNCKTAQTEIDSYVNANAFEANPTLWLTPDERHVVVGLQAATITEAQDFLRTARDLSKKEEFKQESLGTARIRTNPRWQPLGTCADISGLTR